MKTLDEQYSYMFDENYEPSKLGKVAFSRWRKDPNSLLFSLSRYKFVSKFLEGKNNILEVGCGDGWCSRVVAKKFKSLTLSDYDPQFVKEATQVNSDLKNIEFKINDFTKGHIIGNEYDGFYCLDVLEHIAKEKENEFIKNIIKSCRKNAIFIFGMPTKESQKLIKPENRDPGHINCKTKDELKKSLELSFEIVFTLSMNDELIHTGNGNMAYYIFGICCMPKYFY